MKAAINMILFFLTLSFCTNAAQAQARRALITKKPRITNKLVIRDSLSTGRVIDHRSTNQTRLNSTSAIERNGRVVDHRRSVNKKTVDHRPGSNIVAPNNRSATLKNRPDGTSNTRNLRQSVVVKRKQ